jgi:hypothetical protein
MSFVKGQKVRINATVLDSTSRTVKVQIASKGGVLVGTLAPRLATSDAIGQETTPILDFQGTTPILD